MITRKLLFLLLMLLPALESAHADDAYQQVIVADPYVDVHTGHGNSYPVFHVIERGEKIEIIMRHTSWFKIRNDDGVEGWIPVEQMSMTLSPDNREEIELNTFTQEDYIARNWEVGLLGGRFSSADALTLYVAYIFNNSLTAELSGAQTIGDTSSSDLYKISLVMQPFPEFRFSPYVTLGTGSIRTSPKSTLVQPVDTSNQFSNFGLGVRTYLSRRILLRIEYSNYVLFSANANNDSNEDINEWKVGFAVFF